MINNPCKHDALYLCKSEHAILRNVNLHKYYPNKAIQGYEYNHKSGSEDKEEKL